MGSKKSLKEREDWLIKLTLQKAMQRLNNHVLLATGHEMTEKYKDIILTTKVLENQTEI